MNKPRLYDQFFAQLEDKAAASDEPAGLRHAGQGKNWARLGRPEGWPSWTQYQMDFQKQVAPARMRVQLYLGNDVQRKGRDVRSELLNEHDDLEDAFGECLRFEQWTTTEHEVAQRLAAYSWPTTVDRAVDEFDRHAEWLLDRHKRLRNAVSVVLPRLAPWA